MKFFKGILTKIPGFTSCKTDVSLKKIIQNHDPELNFHDFDYFRKILINHQFPSQMLSQKELRTKGEKVILTRGFQVDQAFNRPILSAQIRAENPDRAALIQHERLHTIIPQNFDNLCRKRNQKNLLYPRKRVEKIHLDQSAILLKHLIPARHSHRTESTYRTIILVQDRAPQTNRAPSIKGLIEGTVNGWAGPVGSLNPGSDHATKSLCLAVFYQCLFEIIHYKCNIKVFNYSNSYLYNNKIIGMLSGQ